MTDYLTRTELADLVGQGEDGETMMAEQNEGSGAALQTRRPWRGCVS